MSNTNIRSRLRPRKLVSSPIGEGLEVEEVNPEIRREGAVSWCLVYDWQQACSPEYFLDKTSQIYLHPAGRHGLPALLSKVEYMRRFIERRLPAGSALAITFHPSAESAMGQIIGFLKSLKLKNVGYFRRNNGGLIAVGFKGGAPQRVEMSEIFVVLQDTLNVKPWWFKPIIILILLGLIIWFFTSGSGSELK